MICVLYALCSIWRMFPGKGLYYPDLADHLNAVDDVDNDLSDLSVVCGISTLRYGNILTFQHSNTATIGHSITTTKQHSIIYLQQPPSDIPILQHTHSNDRASRHSNIPTHVSYIKSNTRANP